MATTRFTEATQPSSSEFSVGPLELRPEERTALVEGVRIDLTVREFEVLAALAERPDRVVTREGIYDRVWGGQMPHRDRGVDVHVRRLRVKLSTAAPQWSFVHTHFGVGYRLAPEHLEQDLLEQVA